MKFIKISLLSLLLLFLGLFGIVFGTLVNSSSNNSSNVNLLKSEREEYIAPPINTENTDAPTPIGFSLEFDEKNYWESNGQGNRIYVTADWSTPNDWYIDDPYALIKVKDVETKEIVQGSEVRASDAIINENNSLTKTDEDNITYWHYVAMIENNTTDGVQFFLEENHEYIISVELNNYGWRQEKQFTTPSKSVINFASTIGDIINVTNQSVVIDTNWDQDLNQVADITFNIDENLELTLITGTSSSDYVDIGGEIPINIKEDSIEVTGLDSEKKYNWSIIGNYYNGYENITIAPFFFEFETNAGINYNYDTVKISSTDNSITVELEITNALEQPVDMRFYDGSSKDGNRTELTEVTMISGESSSDTDPTVVSGLVTYEITGLDYNTEYDLYIQIGDNYDEQLGLITTLDAYPWTAPLNITLLVIIIIEVVASAALFGLLFMHSREKASL